MSTRCSQVLCYIFLAASLALAGTGCGSACKELAHKICKCQPTRAKESRCKIAVNAAAKNFDISDQEENRCQKILDSGECTCEALEAGEYAACGLSSDPMDAYED